MQSAYAIQVLVALAFLPPLLFAFWVRAHEKHNREPVHAVLLLFGYGGTLGVMLAIFLNLVFEVGFAGPTDSLGFNPALFPTIIGAPLMEELAKGFGLRVARPRLRELEDGIVYGAAIGLGFAATENFIYGYQALTAEGSALAMQTIVVRIISSTMLHAGSTALLGFGYALVVLRRGVVFELLPFYLIAVAQHALYNFLVSEFSTGGFVVAVLFVVIVAGMLRHRIKVLDRRGQPAPRLPDEPS